MLTNVLIGQAEMIGKHTHVLTLYGRSGNRAWSTPGAWWCNDDGLLGSFSATTNENDGKENRPTCFTKVIWVRVS